VTATAALDCDSGLGKGSLEIDVERLVASRESSEEVGQLLAVVLNVLATDLERNNAILAVLVGVDGIENGEKVLHLDLHVVDVFLARDELDVIDEYGTDLLTKKVVVESSIALHTHC